MNNDDYVDTESDVEKRAYHNLLERKRRDHIKDSFSSLRDVLPVFKTEKTKASRAQILKKAVDFIVVTNRKNSAHVQDIQDLKRENVLLEEQIHTLQEAIETGNLDDVPDYTMTPPASTSARYSSASEAASESEEESEDDDESSEYSEEESPKPRRKRRKVDS